MEGSRYGDAMLILTRADVQAVLTMPRAFDAVERAATAHVDGHSDSPARTAMHGGADEFLVMPGIVEGTFATKIWYALTEPRGSVPASSALVLVVDPGLGHEVLLEAGHLTDVRTGAMTGLAARTLARGARTVGVVGTGIQARTQILAVLHALPSLVSVKVFSRNRERCHAFQATMQSAVDLEFDRPIEIVASESAQAACTDSAIVIAATTSHTPVIDASWVTNASLVCSVGSHAPDEAELDPEIIAAADLVVVDTFRGGIDGAGDISDVINAGALRRDAVLELGTILRAPAAPTRTRSVFKSVGFSAADVACARVVAETCLREGRGTIIDLRS